MTAATLWRWWDAPPSILIPGMDQIQPSVDKQTAYYQHHHIQNIAFVQSLDRRQETLMGLSFPSCSTSSPSMVRLAADSSWSLELNSSSTYSHSSHSQLPITFLSNLTRDRGPPTQLCRILHQCNEAWHSFTIHSLIIHNSKLRISLMLLVEVSLQGAQCQWT